jgi:hypothetical protein
MLSRGGGLRRHRDWPRVVLSALNIDVGYGIDAHDVAVTIAMTDGGLLVP